MTPHRPVSLRVFTFTRVAAVKPSVRASHIGIPFYAPYRTSSAPTLPPAVPRPEPLVTGAGSLVGRTLSSPHPPAGV